MVFIRHLLWLIAISLSEMCRTHPVEVKELPGRAGSRSITFDIISHLQSRKEGDLLALIANMLQLAVEVAGFGFKPFLFI